MVLPESLKIALGATVLVILGLGYAARRYPDVAWLQPFDLQRHVDPVRRAQLRRRANVYAGAQLILLGIVIPLGYLALKVILFSSMDRTGMTVALGASLLCIVLGITAIVRNR